MGWVKATGLDKERAGQQGLSITTSMAWRGSGIILPELELTREVGGMKSYATSRADNQSDHIF